MNMFSSHAFGTKTVHNHNIEPQNNNTELTSSEMKHLDLQRLCQILRPQLSAPFYQEYGEVNEEVEENGFREEPHRPSALQPRSQETAAFALGRNYLFLQPWLGPHRRWPPMASAAWPRHMWHPHKRRPAGSTSHLTMFPARPAMSR